MSKPIKLYKLDENGKKIPVSLLGMTPEENNGDKFVYDLFSKFALENLDPLTRAGYRVAKPGEAEEDEQEPETELEKLRKQLAAMQRDNEDLKKNSEALVAHLEKANDKKAKKNQEPATQGEEVKESTPDFIPPPQS